MWAMTTLNAGRGDTIVRLSAYVYFDCLCGLAFCATFTFEIGLAFVPSPAILANCFIEIICDYFTSETIHDLSITERLTSLRLNHVAFGDDETGSGLCLFESVTTDFDG